MSQRQTTVGLLLPSSDTRTISQAFTWDDLGHVAGLGYPDDLGLATDPVRNVAFTYTNGFLTAAGEWVNTAGGPVAVPSFVSSISYHPNTMVNQIAHLNGVTDTYAKDLNDMARPRSISTAGATINGAPANWSSGSYTYDGAGNIWEIGSDWYLYDLVSRLKEGYVGSVSMKQCALFDAFGNILGLAQIATTGTCPTSGSYSINAQTNRFNAPDTYDAAGNETYNGLRTYTWDKWNQMATAVGNGVNRSYLCTASGERIADRDNNIGGVTTIAVRDLGGKVLRLFLESSTVVNGVLQHQATTWSEDFVWGNGMLLASVSADPDAGTRHYTRDHLGTLRLITGACGAVVARHDYYPFGLEASTSTDGERMKFTAHERDAATGLDYMHARHHDFGVGRSLSTDPAGASDPHAPQSWHRYAYARNNPIKYVDPNGKWPTGWVLIFGGPVHQNMIDRTLSSRVSPQGLDTLRRAQVYADSRQTDQAWHGMANAGETPDDARQRANDFVRERVQAARVEKQAGHESMGLFQIGLAMHPVVDSTSPGHEGFQQWKGPPLASIGNFLSDAWHVAGEDYDPGAFLGTSLGDRATSWMFQFYEDPTKQLPEDFFDPRLWQPEMAKRYIASAPGVDQGNVP